MHKKTIKRGGREFGPYFYTTARAKDGKVKTHYLGTNKETARQRKKEILLSYRRKKPLLKALMAVFATFSGMPCWGVVGK